MIKKSKQILNLLHDNIVRETLLFETCTVYLAEHGFFSDVCLTDKLHNELKMSQRKQILNCVNDSSV